MHVAESLRQENSFPVIVDMLSCDSYFPFLKSILLLESATWSQLPMRVDKQQTHCS